MFGVTLTNEQLHTAPAAIEAERSGFTGFAAALREILRRQLSQR